MSSVNLFKTVAKISLCQNYHTVAKKSLLHKSHCDKKITVAKKSLLQKSHCCKKVTPYPPPVEIWNPLQWKYRTPSSGNMEPPPVEIRA